MPFTYRAPHLPKANLLHTVQLVVNVGALWETPYRPVPYISASHMWVSPYGTVEVQPIHKILIAYFKDF